MKITCDKFPEGSRKRAICDGTIDWPLDKINAFRKQLGSEPLAEKPESSYVLQPARRIKTTTAPMGGHSRPDSTSSIPRAKQPGTRLKEEFAKWNAEECPICSGLASQMDAGGPKYCRENLEKLVNSITERGKDWFVKNYPSANSLLWLAGSTIKAAAAVGSMIVGKKAEQPIESTVLRDIGIRLMVKNLVTKAITDTETEEAELKKKPLQSGRDPAAAAGRYFESLKKEQSRFYTENKKAAKPTPDPFDGTPIIHFGAHLWPVKDHWHWHVDLWNTLPNKINGKLIVVVATDKNSQKFEDVRKRLHPAIEAIETTNTHEGENPSFQILQTMIPSGNNDIFLYCHGKGVQDRTYQSPAVRAWSEAMYETVIFNHDEIIRRLGEGYKNFHSFRMFGMILRTKYQWHPSGTFFAVRAKYLKEKSVRRGYGGVEAWSGDHFPANETWCEIGDGAICTDLYDIVKFNKLILPQLDAWRARRGIK